MGIGCRESAAFQGSWISANRMMAKLANRFVPLPASAVVAIATKENRPGRDDAFESF
ncbi:MAG: hypothetical protein HQM04_18860 [Magnetococcales bacterium]|nr:hypothetical protein [Magnetococcales bacterium]MBF0117091.1 hypothetical protein [Magnetococcales bacterium]